jgi:uncharacterized phage protein gp47/JayE
MTTNVPQIVFTPTGLTIPTEAEILAGVQLDNNAAFGGNLNPALETPQGQMASSLAAIISDKDSQIALLVNQIDPTYSEGRFQDAIGKIYFITRKPPTKTTVNAYCLGLDGTVIPVGATAKNGSTQEIYTCIVGGTITSGVAICKFENNNPGPSPCPSNALNTIYQQIPGWDTVQNLVDGDIGSFVESRREFENRRRETVAGNAVGYNQAIKANALNVTGVSSAFVIDNPTASPVTVRGVTIAAYSVYAAVVGGDVNDVAYALWRKKAGGPPWAAGNTTVTVYDTDYPLPYPPYVVTYTTPANIPIFFAVSISANSLLPANINDLIKTAIYNVFNGLVDGESSVQIGSSIFASRFYGEISKTSPYCNIVSLFVGRSASPSAISVSIDIDEYPVLNLSDISVTQV